MTLRTLGFLFSTLIFIIIITHVVFADSESDIDVLVGKALDAFTAGEYDKAISYYDQILEIEPNHIPTLNNKGTTLVQLDKLEEALLYFDQVLEIDPNNVPVLNNKVSVLYKLGELEEALLYFDKVLEIGPKNINALLDVGINIAAFGEYKKALLYFDQVLEIDPNNIAALDNKGVALFHLKRGAEAIPYFDMVLEVEPDRLNTLNSKGVALASLGRSEEAISYFNRALEINPDYLDAKIYLDTVLGKLSYKPIEGMVETTIRNHQGHLIAFLRTYDVKILEHEITHQLIDDWILDDVITRDGQEFEIRHEQMQLVSRKNYEYSTDLFRFSGNTGVPLISSIHYLVPIEKGDVFDFVITIVRPVE